MSSWNQRHHTGKKHKKQPKREAILHPLQRERPLLFEGKSYLHFCVKIFTLRSRCARGKTWTQQWGCGYRRPVSPPCHCFLGCYTLSWGYISATCFALPSCPPLLASPQNHQSLSTRSVQETWAGSPTSQHAEGIQNFLLPVFPSVVPKAGSNALT